MWLGAIIEATSLTVDAGTFLCFRNVCLCVRLWVSCHPVHLRSACSNVLLSCPDCRLPFVLAEQLLEPGCWCKGFVPRSQNRPWIKLISSFIKRRNHSWFSKMCIQVSTLFEPNPWAAFASFVFIIYGLHNFFYGFWSNKSNEWCPRSLNILRR